MQVIVYGKTLKDSDIPIIQTLFDRLHKENISACIYAPFYERIKGRIHFKRGIGIFEGYHDFQDRKFDFFITLGGDGTILSAITTIRDKGIPILGINLGRLGFLASIEKKRIVEVIGLLKEGSYTVQERQMLYLDTDLPIFGETRFALNDFTLLKRDNSSMITVHAYINGSFLNSFWADGVILATPTGSTGYSLSCGGPIIFPNSGNFVLTSVAPHNLNVRPIVISDESEISFEIEGRGDNFLCTLDSRFEAITSGHKMALRKNDFPIRLVKMQEARFMQTLRSKLMWGNDARNY